MISIFLGPSVVFTEISTNSYSEKLELCEKYWETRRRARHRGTSLKMKATFPQYQEQVLQSKVKVAPDFNKVNVFWVARGTENDVVVERILKKSAGQLRQELTELHVMGVVPHIDFVKDKKFAKAAEVDRILATADFGEDYVPIDAGHQLNSEFTLHTSLPPKVKSCIEELENGIPEPPLPPMRMDVLGLKHDEVMNKIKMSMKKSQAVHRHEVKIPLDNSRNSESVVQNLEDSNYDIVYNLKNEDFTKFLMKRQYMQKKVLRGNKNYSPESELCENEVQEISDFIDSVEEETDYINDSEDVSFINK